MVKVHLNNLCLQFNGKRKYSGSCRLIIVRQLLKISETSRTIYLRKKEKREEKHTEAQFIFPQAIHEYFLFRSPKMLYEAQSSQQLVLILPSYRTWPWTPRSRTQIVGKRFETEFDNRGSAGANQRRRWWGQQRVSVPVDIWANVFSFVTDCSLRRCLLA